MELKDTLFFTVYGFACVQFLHITQVTNDMNFWEAVYTVLLRFRMAQVKWRNALKKAENNLMGACTRPTLRHE